MPAQCHAMDDPQLRLRPPDCNIACPASRDYRPASKNDVFLAIVVEGGRDRVAPGYR
jgi:hypothetical protein